MLDTSKYFDVDNSKWELYSQEYVGDKSPYIVMHSPAGWYIGKTCWEEEFGCYMAWNRYSVYFASEGIANDYLNLCEPHEWEYHRYAWVDMETICATLQYRKAELEASQLPSFVVD